MSGRFITLEGIEGVGKSTHLDFVCRYLRDHGREVVATREPGGTALGEALRQVLLNPAYNGMSGDAELLLMFAARAEHLARVIQPAVAAGRWVVSDRFTDATYAYQGGGRGLDKSRIAALEQWLQGSLRPQLTVLLDAPVAVSLARARQRGGEVDRFEQERHGFFERVRQAYLDIAAAQPQRVRVIDASGDLAAVQGALRQVLDDCLAGAS